jgi:hypothetical protein
MANVRVPCDLGFIDQFREHGQVVPYTLPYIMTLIRVSRSPDGFG